MYYRINERNQINIKTPLKEDEVVRVSGKNHHFIPLQKAQQKQLQITLTDQPLMAGNYFVIREKDTLQSLAFNYPKQESSFNFLDVPALLKSKKNITSATSIKKVLQEIQQKNKVQWLWKWFLTLAIVSLLVEIFILKFFTS